MFIVGKGVETRRRFTCRKCLYALDAAEDELEKLDDGGFAYMCPICKEKRTVAEKDTIFYAPVESDGPAE